MVNGEIYCRDLSGQLMKKTRFIAGLLFLGMLSVMMLAACMKVVALPPVNTDPNGIAIKGYDPVAYFTEGEPVKGKNEFEFSWRGARWLFASSEHRDLFMSDPEKYAPQYGGY